MSTPPQEPSEAELRAAYEEQIKQIRVEDIVIENLVTLINLGMRRTGLVQGSESERDPEQVRVAIESVRALMPVVETIAPEQTTAIRQALSQLQLGYVRIGGAPAPGGDQPPAPPAAAPSPSAASPEAGPQAAPGEAPDPGAPGDATPGEPGPAQRSGRLWIPGQ
jgi:hypothetical protein